MKRLTIALLLTGLVLAAGCSARQQAADLPDSDLIQCRGRADKDHAARYTDAWQQSVRNCMEARGRAYSW